MSEPAVAGFVYDGSREDKHDGTVCKIIARVTASPVWDLQPMFLVKFGDGEELEVLGECLHPWYPT